ncbi:hypothetical protein IWW36_000746 [Coemansia brasiliensis]|uniref:Uncharacterized protein n=1 Tax=Coemansia brasiliensis TaxID=2650707 RepID=A0A9W8IAN4_9FUNG|nr:hypothetical protein IWW36_000746 [Coemansia brasiliensis]
MALVKSKQPILPRPAQSARRTDDSAKISAADSDNTDDAETTNGNAATASKVSPESPPPTRPATSKASASQAKRTGSASGNVRVHAQPVVQTAPHPTHTAATVGTGPPVATFVLPPPPLTDSNLSLTRIIEEYGEQTDLLKLVLTAKTEQDRARAEYERRVQEELRFETRRVEFEMMLHSNYFKQQEQQQQQQLMAHPQIHRGDLVVQSPIGPMTHASRPQQQQQQQTVPTGHIVASGSYAMPVAHDLNQARSYHHPDTPGGLDGRNVQNPFAFFKMPLGQHVHHPSAYATHGEKGSTSSSQHVVNAAAAHPAANTAPRANSGGSGAPANTMIGNRRPVPPAVSGLSVQIVGGDANKANAPHSAPVDGPEQKKRKVSHDEVIMALRRKVMSKGTQWQQHSASQSTPQKSIAPRRHNTAHQKHLSEDASKLRRSSLAIITRADSTDDMAISESSESSESSSESSSSTPLSATQHGAEVAEPVENCTPNVKDGGDKMRVSSISLIVDQEVTPRVSSSSEQDKNSGR